MHQWSVVPLANQTADSRANWQEGQPASSLNNSARGVMATAAFWRDDNLGILTATLGANNVYSVSTGQGLIDPASVQGGGTAKISHAFSLGVVLPPMNTAVATAAPTIVIDGAAAVPLVRRDGTALADGDLTGVPYEILGDTITAGAYGRARILDLLASDIAALSPKQSGQNACKLSFVSATQLLLNRLGGTTVTINGAPQTIPAAGVSLSNSGLAASTPLYVYAFVSGTTMTLEAVTTAPAVDANSGAMVKTGDATRALVGAILTTASGTFQGGCGTLSYFNRRDLATTTGQFVTTTSSPSYTILSGSVMYGLAWADEAVDAEYTGSGGITGQNAGVYANMRTTIGDVGITTPQLYGPQSRAGGSNFVIGGLASRLVNTFGAVTAFGVWAQGFGDAGQGVGYTLAGTLKTRG